MPVIKTKVCHESYIDKCIADEIKELANKHNILTLYSCCGHGEPGFIVVHPDDISKMKEIGYELNGEFATPGVNEGQKPASLLDIKYKFPSFRTKSVCVCE